MGEPIAEVGYLAGVCFFDGTDWVKSNLLCGYNDRWFESVSDLSADAGDNTLSTVAVPPGYLYVLQAISAQNNITDPSSIHLHVGDGATAVTVRYQATPGIALPVVWTGKIVLKEGDVADALLRGCTAGDDIFAFFWGYKMKLAM